MTQADTVNCSFCGKGPRAEEPGRLAVVKGPGANICAECVELCAVVLEETQPSRPLFLPREEI